MTAVAIDQRLSRRSATRNDAVPLLQIFALSVMVFPSDTVIKAIGGAGYIAALVSYVLFLSWLAATLFGLHNPLDYRQPTRISLAMLWLVSLTSYALMNRAMLSTTQLTAADRWLMQLAGISGVILVAAEFLRSIEDIRRVLRAFVWGGAFCGVVAALQFWLRIDITHYLRLPGFSLNQAATSNSGIGARGGLNRVPGTAIDPIELGVTAGMLLPLAIYMALHDLRNSPWLRWTPVICITLAIPASVSRAAFLAVTISLGVLIVSLPSARRLWALAAVLLAIVGLFMTAHGLIGTLKSYFLAGTSDASVAHRVNNYPFVEQMVREAPWFGQGGGTYISQDAIHILDNEYLTTAIELGLVGLAALAFFFIWPALAALVARGRTANAELRDLCAALAGADLAATLCSTAFDSLSFPMFMNVQALVAGLIGAVWLLVNREEMSTGLLSFRHRQAGTPIVTNSGGF
jgi:O-antigen ligase